MSEIKSKISKLFAHAESEKKIGNLAAAQTYDKQAKALLKKHKLTKKSLAEPETFNFGGEWICSCNAKISLNFSGASKESVTLANLILMPHQGNGHQLTKIA